jgi:CRISPR/Cas system-associated endoribonuclease Cas2
MDMKRTLTYSLLILASSTLMLVGGAVAQTTTNSDTSGAGPGKVDPAHPRVNEVNAREENQQDRIANGVQNGQLTSGETKRLERGEQRLVNNEKKDMAADNGHLTKQDQRQLNNEENRLNNRIYDDKHNARTQSSGTSGAGPGKVDPGHPRVNEVNAKEGNQQQRIANGVRSGQLTPGETARLERGEQRLQQNEKKDMAADGGHLTKQDKRQLNKEENRMSKRIYKDKHNVAKK